MVVPIAHRILAGLTGVLLVAAPLRAGPTAHPARQETLQHQRDNYVESLKVLMPLGGHTMSELLQLKVDGGRIVLHTELTPWSDYLPRRADIIGLASPAAITYTRVDPAAAFGGRPVGLRHFEYSQEEYPDADTFVRLRLVWRSGPSSGELTIECNQQTSDSYQRILYTQTIQRATMIIFGNGPAAPGGPASLNLSERDFDALRQHHPAAVEQWLRPVFRRLLQEAALAPDPNAAWQALADDWPVNRAVRAAVAALLPQLDSPEWRARGRACDDLARLGRDGATAVLRLDRHALSAEQNVRLDEVLSRYRRLPGDEAGKLANDPDFLLDCQYCEDALVRRIAAERLSRILKHPIEIEPSASESDRAAYVEKIRTTLHAPAATQP